MSVFSFIKKYFVYFLVSISLLLFLIYLKFENTPPHWDAGRHYYNSTKYWELLKAVFTSPRENGHFDALVVFFKGYFYYPPLVYWVSLPFQLLFGRTYQASLASNFVWILALGSFTNLWLRQLSFAKPVRIIALAFLLGSPFIIGQSREFQVDLPLLTMLIVTFWSAEKLIQRFNLRNSLIFSFAFCLGMMTKWSFALFIIPGLTIYIARFIYLIWKYKNVKISDISFTVYTFILSIFGICSIWYLPNIVRLKLDLFQNSTTTGIQEGDPQGYTLDSFLFYANNAVINQYLWLPWLLFFAGLLSLVIFFVFRDKIKFGEIFGTNKLTFAIILAFFNFIIMFVYLMKQGNKDVRYAIILYPSLILFLAFCSQFLINVKKFKIIKYVSFVAIALFLGNQLNLTLPLGDNPLIIAEKTKFPITVVGANGYTNTRLKNKDWAIYKVLDKTASLKNEYINKNDTCLVDGYWYLRPTIGVDFDPQPLHTNYGTVWGLSEQYGMQIGFPDTSCFMMIGRMSPLENIDISKYENTYDFVGQYTDWQGFNAKLLKKK